METLLGKHWHHVPPEQVAELLESNPTSGLDLFEIQHRQERFGPNVLSAKHGKSAFVRFLLQFNNPLIYILLAASVVTAVVKDLVDAAIIFATILVNVIIGYIQESKAEAAIEALAQTIITEATVLRAGRTQRITATELVPGDIVSFKSGDKVPADVRLLQARDLQIAEASLTGESVPVQKTAAVTLPPNTPLAERRNMAYASTLVTYGQGMGIVTATGDNTEVGLISKLISETEELTTPLTRQIARFSRYILYAILLLAAMTFAIGVWRGQLVGETLTAAIALAVGMIPEGLPAAVTVTLAIGVSRMASRRAIIRKLPAVETLGSVTIICSDKTGTLTQNQMTVRQVAVAGGRYELTGSGYDPIGEIIPQGSEHSAALAEIKPDSALAECLTAGLLCNDSHLVEREGVFEAQGDPTEVALLVSARKGGLSDDSVSLPRVDAIPFESERQYMATLHDAGPDKPRLIYIKGAVEVILGKSRLVLNDSGETADLDAAAIQREADSMAEQGLRVLAFARKEMPSGAKTLSHTDVTSDLTFLGLQGMIDPPRLQAIQAVETCQRAGIQVKMITGDHVLTALAIARQLGLNGATERSQELMAMTGRDMDECCDEDLIERVERTAVFARVSPEQKLRLVEALQFRRHIVAMTGDGVNDGPALKQSDIGIAMGITGTEVAKEAADMILTDDNFATIEAAVEEGRGVYDNLTKIITWTLPTNLGEGLLILLAIFLGAILPVLPIHVLWINMTTVAALGIVLALERKEPNIMDRPPRDAQSPILSRKLVLRILLVSIIILLGAFGLFEWELSSGASIAQARTVAVNVVVVVEMFYLLNCRSLTQSMLRIGLFSNPWIIAGMAAMILLQLLFTYAPPLNSVFATAPLGPESWVRIILVGLVSYFVVEFEKSRRKQYV